MTDVPAAVVKELAPTGTLRVALNLVNTVLVQTDPATGQYKGVTVDLAQELGRRLGVPIAFMPFQGAGKAVEAFKAGALDVAFLANEPARAAEVAFTPPYVLIEGVYLVRTDSPFRQAEELDRDGVRIGVNTASAYDLFLTRTLKHATLVRSDSGIAAFLKDGLDAAAGVGQIMAERVKADPSLRVVEGSFMQIPQAMATQRGRPAASDYLHAFIEDMKRNGFVKEALARSGQGDATVAPPA
ncbi:MAG: transporter substrate-binding domain-containing protein [Pseudorhodoplanes sp.]